jgi:hypothetical protein
VPPSVEPAQPALLPVMIEAALIAPPSKVMVSPYAGLASP